MFKFSNVIIKPEEYATYRKKFTKREVVANPSILMQGTVSLLPFVFVLRTFVLSDTCNYINGQ
jgi:hypothetical protein